MKYKLTPKRRKWMRWFAVCLASFMVVVILMPMIFSLKNKPIDTDHSSSDPYAASSASGQGDAWIPVYLTKEKKTKMVSLEQYVRGVVAAEMPIEFEIEALKAQALAARTYIIRRLLDGDRSNVPGLDALVTDTISHQAYVTDDELKTRWSGEQYISHMDKLNRAVEETKDLILTYQGSPIEATFFSTSNGFTENSEDYWNLKIPYLRSVESPWDIKLSPRYKETVTFTAKEIQQKLKLPYATPVSLNGSAKIKVIEKSQGQRIKKISINGKTFTGKEIREKLGLNSSQFQWDWKNGYWQITTYGYGHGVGMSQWGANGMALEGRTAEEIVKHYYTGIEIGKATTLLDAKGILKKK